ncbi:hypothetical protein [Companilactobacillus bobalius]|uniref:Uncharacterized protein n=1 Tax=Companilactobacillus bobalius TaxID=2801451 RepID=A0A202F7P1_9LACO|nr:hypothetical protein [Companilactobacillus bobalius]KAE9557545.1 hypothetical protein ATN92_15435 [Companilactobacillus bobalius]KAE9563691.1 hypothetical protein ATN92_02885 [Companilactobacillus bobalius]OVE96514.1 hypothetical protein LKACC16343_02181 [Companilactobacillus bobalius]GEO58511.1 hypothetical protein LBO01_16400 [Companilactobacillus paralimentarius]
MENHEYVYFYKDGNDRIPILTGGTSRFSMIFFIDEAEKKSLSKLLPSNKNLYVMVDGKVFRVCKAEKH